MKNVFLTSILFFILLFTSSYSQGNPEYLRTGILYGNKLTLLFNNDGGLSSLPSNSVLKWKGNRYLMDSQVLIGVEINSSLKTVIIPRSPRNHASEERHPEYGYFWGFNPIPGYFNIAYDSIAVSINPNTWPLTWPDHPEYGANVWNGLFGANSFTGSMETYFKIDDRSDDELYYHYGFLPNPPDTIKGYGISVGVRYIQLSDPESRDILFAVYDIKNSSIYNYNKVFLGKIEGTIFGENGDASDDLADFRDSLNMIFSWDCDYKGSVGQRIGVLGENFIRCADISNDIASFDFFNLSSSPDMSNDNLLWEIFTPGRILHNTIPQDGDHLFGTGYFNLNSGETKRVVTAIGMGNTISESFLNLIHASALYNNNFNLNQLHNRIQFTYPAYYEILHGTETLRWSSDVNGRIDIYFSPENGKSWQKKFSNLIDNGSFQVNTSDLPDCAFGRFLIVKKDLQGNITGYHQSNPFSIDNSENGLPYVQIISPVFDKDSTVTEKYLDMSILAGDPEKSNLTLKFYYSIDKGNSYQEISEVVAPSDSITRNYSISVADLPNTANALIKVTASDGNSLFYDSTYYFNKQTIRDPLPQGNVVKLSGPSIVPFSVSVVDSGSIAASKYIISFNDTSFTGKKYIKILNADKNQTVLEQIYNPATEVVFDGLSFNSDDFVTKVDTLIWTQGPTTNVTISASRFQDPQFPVNNGYTNPFDYQIDFFDSIVDTSLVDTLFPNRIVPAIPVNYTIKNLQNNTYVNTIFINSGTIVTTSSLILKEEVLGRLRKTWRIDISRTAGQPLPGAFNTLNLFTEKGFSIYDSILVKDLPADIEDIYLVSNYQLYQNFPNPFNPITSIRFSVPSRALVSLKVFDILGRVIKELVNAEFEKGMYTVQFDAQQFASGVYFYTMQANDFVTTKKLLLLK